MWLTQKKLLDSNLTTSKYKNFYTSKEYHYYNVQEDTFVSWWRAQYTVNKQVEWVPWCRHWGKSCGPRHPELVQPRGPDNSSGQTQRGHWDSAPTRPPHLYTPAEHLYRCEACRTENTESFTCLKLRRENCGKVWRRKDNVIQRCWYFLMTRIITLNKTKQKEKSFWLKQIWFISNDLILLIFW